MTKLTDKTTAMPIPEGAERVYYDGANSIGFYLNGELRFIHFPPGSWRFLFTTKAATEEQAHPVVENVTTANELPVYRDYEFSMWTKSAVGSLKSLLRSKGLDENKNYAIIEKL